MTESQLVGIPAKFDIMMQVIFRDVTPVHEKIKRRGNVLHEDFGDEPSIEERMPFGVSQEEMRAVFKKFWNMTAVSIVSCYLTQENS